jgi:hypothetical protein
MKNKSAKKLAEVIDEQTKQKLQKRFKLDKNFKPIRIAAANNQMLKALVFTGHRSSEVLTAKHYIKKAGV